MQSSGCTVFVNLHKSLPPRFEEATPVCSLEMAVAGCRGMEGGQSFVFRNYESPLLTVCVSVPPLPRLDFCWLGSMVHEITVGGTGRIGGGASGWRMKNACKMTKTKPRKTKVANVLQTKENTFAPSRSTALFFCLCTNENLATPNHIWQVLSNYEMGYSWLSRFFITLFFHPGKNPLGQRIRTLKIEALNFLRFRFVDDMGKITIFISL